MRLFDLFKRKEKAPKATDTKGFSVDTIHDRMFTGRLVIGENGHNVIPEENSAVVSALRWTMRNFPKAPQVVQRLNGNQYELIANHPALKLLRQPNAFMSGRSLGNAIACSLMLDGNAYIFKVRNGNGKVAELQFLVHGHVVPVTGKDVPIAYYEYRVSGRTIRLETADVIHIRDGCDPSNPYMGWSGLKSIVNEILTDQEASAYSYAVLKNLGITGLIISPTGENVIGEDQAELLKKLVKQSTTGDHRAEPIVSSHDVKITTNSVNPEQMALDKMRSVPESRIAAVIGLPAMVLGLLSGEATKTYANYGEARDAALEDWLLPLYALIDDALTCQLLPEFGLQFDDRIDRDLTKISALQEDLNALAQRLCVLYQTGIINRAEARQPLDLPTTEADNVYWIDAQATGLSTDMAKSIVKADIQAKRAYRDSYREAA